MCDDDDVTGVEKNFIA